MSRFKEGDLILIARQPTNQFVQLVGEKGYIEEVGDGSDGKFYYNVRTLTERGLGGAGTVPEDCLEPCETTELRRMKEGYDRQQQRHNEEVCRRTAKLEKRLLAISIKHRISYRKLLKIRSDINDAEYF